MNGEALSPTVTAPCDDVNREVEFVALMERYRPALGRMAAAYEANPALREELLQEIAMAIWRALPRYRSQCPLRNYIFRIAHNRAVSHIAIYAAMPPTTGYADEQHAHAESPEQRLAINERSEKLLKGIRALPTAQRQLVMLSLEGFSYDEISNITGFSKTNVGARLTRARDALKKRLGNND